MFDSFTEWFTPFVYEHQLENTREVCKNYSKTSIFGLTRTDEQVFNNSINGEAVEYHLVNVYTLLGEDILHTDDYTDIKLNNKIIECKSFMNIASLPEIIDHFINTNKGESDYLWIFRRKGSWNSNLQYQLFCVYNIRENSFDFINNSYDKYKDVIEYIQYKFERSK